MRAPPLATWCQHECSDGPPPLRTMATAGHCTAWQAGKLGEHKKAVEVLETLEMGPGPGAGMGGTTPAARLAAAAAPAAAATAKRLPTRVPHHLLYCHTTQLQCFYT